MPGAPSAGVLIPWDKDYNLQFRSEGQKLMQLEEFVSGHTEISNGPGTGS